LCGNQDSCVFSSGLKLWHIRNVSLEAQSLYRVQLMAYSLMSTVGMSYLCFGVCWQSCKVSFRNILSCVLIISFLSSPRNVHFAARRAPGLPLAARAYFFKLPAPKVSSRQIKHTSWIGLMRLVEECKVKVLQTWNGILLCK